MPRLHKTLADYIAIAISPALIMVLVGSLVYFLAAVFYQGQYPTRLNLVLGCFVFASTLIGRISIEQGRARAVPFAIALGGATAFAMWRFVEYQGAIPQGLSQIVNIGLLGVIWWAADRLVHDCTVIDEGKKSSSEGLMQTMGLDDEPARGTAAKATSERNTAAPNLDGTTTRPGELRSEPAPETKPRSWWERNILRKGKPHTPGLWVVYFSLAALPIFGFGQGLIPQTDVANRQWAFWLFCSYLAAALGLLISTSFLGLRRYLRQRQVEMPGSMAGWWLVTGAVLVVALLAITAILPRPGAEFQLASLDVVAKSPVTNPNKHAIGGEGVETKNSGSASSQSQNPPGQNAPTTQGNRGDAQGGRRGEGGNSSSGGGQRGGSSGGGQRGGNSSQNNQQGNPPQSNQASSGNNSGNNPDHRQGENSQSRGQQNNSQQNAGANNQANNSGNQQSTGGQQQGNNQGNNDQSGDNRDNGNRDSSNRDGGTRDGARGNQSDSQQGNQGGNRSGARGNGDQNNQQTGDNQQNNDQSGNRDGNRDGGRDGNRSGNRNNSQRGNSNTNSGGGGGGSARPPDEQQTDDENAAGKTGDEDENQNTSSSGSGSGSSFDGEAADASSAADELDGESWFDDVDWLTTGFKWLIYIILGAVVLFVGLKYGREILRGFRDFLAGLLNIFGGKPRKKSDGEELTAEAKQASGPPPRPFSSFADPFDTGLAGKVPPKELVRYSFEAFEAWARDRGRPRGEEETPHEFAHDVARSARSVATEARNLADLYDRAAYAPSGVTAERAMSLSGLWKGLRGAHAASATTVTDTDEA